MLVPKCASVSRRRLFQILLISGVLSVLGFIWRVGSYHTATKPLLLTNYTAQFSHEGVRSTPDKYLIDSPGCKIVEDEVFYPGFERQVSKYPDCAKVGRVAALNDETGILSILEDFRGHGGCTVTEIERGGDDKSFQLVNQQRVEDTLNITDQEIFFARCAHHYNLEANFPTTKPEIRSKLDYWKNRHDKEKIPINVLFIGFDSCSRPHYHRSLPKTMRLMQEMGFLDFKGYHSVAPYTLDNFLGYHFGMDSTTLRATCAHTWSSSFDTCPLIWKSFEENNYVTMYAEDGSQTFNWGGQGGFKKRPTNYYLHPLFLARAELHKRFPLKGVSEMCVSHMNPQTFLFKYIQRFFKKFRQTAPFFGFVWNNDATHEDMDALAGMDEDFAEMLNIFKEFPETLERTLVIVASDHGTRFGDVTKISRSGAFLERSLPGFFLRVPKLLKEKLKGSSTENIDSILRGNTQRLITAFDINHTLKHLLVLSGFSFSETVMNENNVSVTKNTSAGNFRPVLKDRSSLFLPVSSSRTCADVHIRMPNCVCNTTRDAPAWENPALRNKLIGFAFEELNGVVDASLYKYMCKTYTPPMMPFLSATSIRSTGEFTDGLIRFRTNPDDATFEVQLRVFHNRSSLDRVERLSRFIRVDKYGDTSWCVGFNTDNDKMLKEICTCHSLSPIRVIFNSFVKWLTG